MLTASPIYRLPSDLTRPSIILKALADVVDWGVAAYHIPDHWKQTQGQGVKVAMLDTGVDETHPALAGAIDDARDFTSSRSGPADQNGHGTHTAGIVAARKDLLGVAPQCRLLIGKVLGDDGSGSGDGVAAGIDWACDAGADVISMSLGSPQADPQIFAAIQRANAKGKFIVCAAGNDGAASQDSVNYPGRWKQTVSVAAVDRDGHLCTFSSRGPEVDIAAPGEDILSTYLDGKYARLSGTSMATPFVAGVTALLVAVHRGATNSKTPLNNDSDLREHLERTATAVGFTGHDDGYGWGLINPDGLLTADDATPPTPPARQVLLADLIIAGVSGSLVFEPK